MVTQGMMDKSVILSYFHGYKQENPLLGIKGTVASRESAVNIREPRLKYPGPFGSGLVKQGRHRGITQGEIKKGDLLCLYAMHQELSLAHFI